jgi:hypothetical protein
MLARQDNGDIDVCHMSFVTKGIQMKTHANRQHTDKQRMKYVCKVFLMLSLANHISLNAAQVWTPTESLDAAQ